MDEVDLRECRLPLVRFWCAWASLAGAADCLPECCCCILRSLVSVLEGWWWLLLVLLALLSLDRSCWVDLLSASATGLLAPTAEYWTAGWL